MSSHSIRWWTAVRIVGILGLASCSPAFSATAAGIVPAGHLGQSGASVTGVVTDASGAAVPGAEVRVQGDARAVETGADGRFEITDVPPGEFVIEVRAPGFASYVQRIVAGAAAPTTVRVSLQPAPLYDTVTVTASRGAERLETPTSTTVLTSAEVLNAAAGALDDALRFTPGFSLFRRSSSRVANPTTQGVTLRGVSGSGASRTLVLADGFPLNDPFGSWVYWNRIPQAAVDRVEVLRGATGDLYGADALGGVIQVLTFDPARPRLRAIVDGASHGTGRGSVFGSAGASGWTVSGAGEWLETDGFDGPAPHESFGREQLEPVYGDYTKVPDAALYVAERHGETAGGAIMRSAGGLAQLCGAATLPAHRRRGVQTALLDVRLFDAASAGCDLAVVTTQPGSKSQENVQRAGFALLYTRAILVRS